MLTYVANGRRADFIVSPAGEEVGKKLYSETMAEMRDYTDVPAGLLAMA